MVQMMAGPVAAPQVRIAAQYANPGWNMGAAVRSPHNGHVNGLRQRAQQRELSCPRSAVGVRWYQPRCRRRNERRMKAPASESNAANTMAGRLLAVCGRVCAASGAAAADTAAGAGAGAGEVVADGEAADAVREGVFGTTAAARGGTTGTNLNDFTSSSRRLSGFLLVSFSSLPPISTQRPSSESVTPASFVLSRSKASAPASAVHEASGTLGTGPFLRTRQHVLVLVRLTAAHGTATKQTPHRGHLPALLLRQEIPITSLLRECGVDGHHPERQDNGRCTKDTLTVHARPPVAWASNNRSAGNPPAKPCCRSAQATGGA